MNLITLPFPMDFFEHQEIARRKTTLLVVYFLLAVILIIAAIYAVFASCSCRRHRPMPPARR